jgi:hypothetical protein
VCGCTHNSESHLSLASSMGSSCMQRVRYGVLRTYGTWILEQLKVQNHYTVSFWGAVRAWGASWGCALLHSDVICSCASRLRDTIEGSGRACYPKVSD